MTCIWQRATTLTNQSDQRTEKWHGSKSHVYNWSGKIGHFRLRFAPVRIENFFAQDHLTHLYMHFTYDFMSMLFLNSFPCEVKWIVCSRARLEMKNAEMSYCGNVTICFKVSLTVINDWSVQTRLNLNKRAFILAYLETSYELNCTRYGGWKKRQWDEACIDPSTRRLRALSTNRAFLEKL